MWAFRNFDRAILIHTVLSFAFSYSEDDQAMDVDSCTTKKTNADDLSEYKLDEYDDTKASSIQDLQNLSTPLLIHFFLSRYGHIQQY